MTGLVMVGASGLAREATGALVAAGHDGPLGVLDDDPARWGTLHGLVPVLGSTDLAAATAALADHEVLLTLGHGRVRRRVAARLGFLGLDAERYATAVHPSVSMAGSCWVDAGSIVLAGVVMTADVSVGRHVVLMPHVTLTHGCVVDDFATICAGVSLGGDVHVGAGAYLGMNSSVRQGVTVGAGATLGMGAVLLEDLPRGETWAGVPARRLEIGALT